MPCTHLILVQFPSPYMVLCAPLKFMLSTKPGISPSTIRCGLKFKNNKTKINNLFLIIGTMMFFF